MSAPKKISRIGILTGGGDCPGLNAVIRVVAKAAINKLGLEVIGVEDGFLGLIENRMRPLTLSDVSGIITVGGTILGTTNRADPARYPVGRRPDGKPIYADVTQRVVEHVNDAGIDLLVCIGGDGTMTCAARFIDHGIPVVGVPKTIDNDLMHTDITFGFTTAVQTATECLDRIHTTGSSHHRVMVVELMGRNAGWLTINAGLAAGADVILVPEIPYELDAIAESCMLRSKHGKRFTLIACSEGARPKGGAQYYKIDENSPDPKRLGGIGQFLAEELAERTSLETRATILGHVQRGGTPVAYDRVLATAFGHKAIQMVAMREWNSIVVMREGRVDFTSVHNVANRQRTMELDDPLIAMARAVGTCMGD